MIRFLITLIIFWNYVLVSGQTIFNCADGSEMYINSADYEIICTDGTYFNLTFGPEVTEVYYTGYEATPYLTGLTFSDSVVIIDEDAFQYCTKLEFINFGNGLQTIGAFAFYNAYSLNSLVIPDTVTSIGESAFRYAYSMHSLTVGNGLQTIDEFAFEYCTDLTTIIWGTGLLEIKAFAFTGSNSLSSITFPDSLETIGQYAFSSCNALESVTFGANLKRIGYSAFSNFGEEIKIKLVPLSIHSVTFTGESSLYIESFAFAGLQLESLVLPKGLYGIGHGAFQDNYLLTSVNFPKSLITIGNDSFMNCTSLAMISIGENTVDIQDSAFEGCVALQCIYWDPNVVRTIGVNAFEGCPLTGCGPSAVPTRRPTAVPTITFNPTVSMAPTFKNTKGPTHLPTISADNDNAVKYSFSMIQSLNGIDAVTFDSKSGNSDLFAATVANCSQMSTIITDISITNVEDDSIDRKLSSDITIANTTDSDSILITYTVEYVAAAKMYNLTWSTITENLKQAVSHKRFSQKIQGLSVQYDASSEMSTVNSDYFDVYSSVIIITDDNIASTDNDDPSSAVEKRLSMKTITIIVGVAVGVFMVLLTIATCVILRQKSTHHKLIGGTVNEGRNVEVTVSRYVAV